MLDFHAHLHAYGAWAAIDGASPEAIQTRVRYATIVLTPDTYAHLLPDEAAETVARMPEAELIALRLTGIGDMPDTAATDAPNRVQYVALFGLIRHDSTRSGTMNTANGNPT